MKLRELLQFDDIVIQCHDNPDADALASGYALLCYLKDNGKNPRLVYGGRNIIHKSNLVMMIEALDIPVEHVEELDNPELLVTVDCQYGEGNVQRFEAQYIAVIDHHRIAGPLPELHQVEPSLGACATLMYRLLKDEGYDPNANSYLATALYYGLYTDTSEFAEITNPLDKDLRDEAVVDPAIITKFRNANMSLEELDIAGTALIGSDYIEEYRLSIVKAGPCDPNVLGIISDLVLAVDAIDLCVVFCVQRNGVKFSVRSCVKEIKASDVAADIGKGIGSGGGHYYKAGGFIELDALTKEYMDICEKRLKAPRIQYNTETNTERPSDSAIKELIEERVIEYLDNTTIIYNATELGMEYKNRSVECIGRRIPLGYVMGADIAEPGEKVVIRTVSGDIDVTIKEDTALLFDDSGRMVQTISGDIDEYFRIYPEWSFSLRDISYIPRCKHIETGENVDLMSKIKTCFAMQLFTSDSVMLENKLKYFHGKDAPAYKSGNPGDMLVMPNDKIDELMILPIDEFELIYMRKEDVDKQIQNVIFDLDGTLLDTLQDLTNAVNYSLETNDMPLRTIDEIRDFIGNGVKVLISRAIPDGYDNPLYDKCLKDFTEYYSGHYLDNTKPYKDIIHLLTELKARGLKVGIVSNKIGPVVELLADKFFEGLIDTAIGTTEELMPKPAVDMITKAMNDLGASKENTVYIGDSEVDIETARNAGLNCVSVLWGFKDRDFLKRMGALFFMESPVDLLKMI